MDIAGSELVVLSAADDEALAAEVARVLGYIDRVQDPVRFEIGLNTVGGDPFIIGGEDGPTAIWLTTPFDVIPFISVIVFVVLGFICIWLIKSTNPPKPES